MILLIAFVVLVCLLLGLVWFAFRKARAESVWQAVDDAKESASVQPDVTPPEKPKANAAHA
jgi:hypothetical protein